jgi:hypothetical protein
MFQPIKSFMVKVIQLGELRMRSIPSLLMAELRQMVRVEIWLVILKSGLLFLPHGFTAYGDRTLQKNDLVGNQKRR